MSLKVKPKKMMKMLIAEVRVEVEKPKENLERVNQKDWKVKGVNRSKKHLKNPKAI